MCGSGRRSSVSQAPAKSRFQCASVVPIARAAGAAPRHRAQRIRRLACGPAARHGRTRRSRAASPAVGCCDRFRLPNRIDGHRARAGPRVRQRSGGTSGYSGDRRCPRTTPVAARCVGPATRWAAVWRGRPATKAAAAGTARAASRHPLRTCWHGCRFGRAPPERGRCRQAIRHGCDRRAERESGSGKKGAVA